MATAPQPLQQQILSAYRQALISARTAAGSSVYIDHPDELTTPMLPAIVIEQGDERITSATLSRPATQQRDLQFDTVAVCAGREAMAAARSLGAEIEAALLSSGATVTASGLAKNLTLLGMRPSVNGQASQLVAELRQSWSVAYLTKAGAPYQSA